MISVMWYRGRFGSDKHSDDIYHLAIFSILSLAMFLQQLFICSFKISFFMFLEAFMAYRLCLSNNFIALKIFNCERQHIKIDHRVLGCHLSRWGICSVSNPHPFSLHAPEWRFSSHTWMILHWYPFMFSTRSITFDQLKYFSVYAVYTWLCFYIKCAKMIYF